MSSGRSPQNCSHIHLDVQRYGIITKIDLMERPLKFIGWADSEGTLLLHFFVLLTFASGESIVVEKIKNPCCNGNVGVRRYDVELDGMTCRIPSIKLYGVQVEFRKLVDLMKELDTSYNVLSSNCWDFAGAFAKAVVKLLDVNANGFDKDSLNRGLNDLKRKERATPYETARFYFKYPSLDRKNNETHRKLERGYEEYLKKHPHSKKRRKVLMKPLEKRRKYMKYRKIVSACRVW